MLSFGFTMRDGEAVHRLFDTLAGLEEWEPTAVVQKREWLTVVRAKHRSKASYATVLLAHPNMAAHVTTAFFRAAGRSRDACPPLPRCVLSATAGTPWALFDIDVSIDLLELFHRWRALGSHESFFDAHDVMGFSNVAFEACAAAEAGGASPAETAWFGSASMANFFCGPNGQVWRLGLFDSLAGPEDEERRLQVVRDNQLSRSSPGAEAALIRALLIGLPTGFVAVHPVIQRALTGTTLPEDAVVEAILTRVALGTWGPSSARFSTMREVISIFGQLGALLGLDGSVERFSARRRMQLRAVGEDVEAGHPSHTQYEASNTGGTGLEAGTVRATRQAGALSDGVQLDLANYQCVRDGTRIALTALEARLLSYLVERPGVVVSTDQLLVEVWGYAPNSSSRAVTDCIKRLRRKIEHDAAVPRHIENVFGVGYKFVP